eukprot:615072-Pelagomonas_calceolata.AAC.2
MQSAWRIKKRLSDAEQSVLLPSADDKISSTHNRCEVDVDCPQASLQPGSSTKLECKVPVPLSIPPSFFGRHIQIDYTIELLGKMDSLTHSFRMDAPIIISSSPPQMLPGPIPSTTPGSGSIPSSLPPKTAGDLPQSYGGVALPSKAAAPALDPHPPLSTVSPGPPHPALPQANGGEAQPCYSYPPMQAPPNCWGEAANIESLSGFCALFWDVVGLLLSFAETIVVKKLYLQAKRGRKCVCFVLRAIPGPCLFRLGVNVSNAREGLQGIFTPPCLARLQLLLTVMLMYPSIQKTAYLDLSTPSATNAKWADGDNDDNDDGFK